MPPWGYAAAAVGTVVAGSMSADAAGSAADAQAQSSAASIAEQRREYDLARQDQQPYMQRGNAAADRLQYLLGLSSVPNANSGGGAGAPSRQDIFNQYEQQLSTNGVDVPYSQLNASDKAGRDATVDARYNAALQQYQAQQQQAGLPAAQNDPAYGSLLKKFDQNDLNNDVVYNSGLQFGLNQGTGAINQRALQSGGYDSGATLKALTQYANDYGSTKANDAYNRYNTDQTNVYNRLAGISGTGQAATNQVQSAGTNMANNVSSALTDQGNARSAGIIGGANAWGSAASGLNSIYNNYNSNQTLQQLLKQNQQSNNVTSYPNNYVGNDPGAGYY